MGNWESHVSSVPAPELGRFIQQQLRPYEGCEKQLQMTVDTIRLFLPGDSFPQVQGVAMGGSYGRKTVLRGDSDGTLIVFLDHLEHFRDQVKIQDKILNAITHQLEECRRVRTLPVQWETLRTPKGLSIVLSTRWQKITFEVLPAFNALGLCENPSPWLYRELIRFMDETKASPGDFAVCFTQLQQKFFNKYPKKVKDLIILIKYWYQQCQKKSGSNVPLATYALELLAVYAWEQGCGAEDFDIAEGVRAILGLILKSQQLCVYWTVNYSLEDETVRNRLLGQLRTQRPVILDPVDLTHSVSGHIPWLELQADAQGWLSSLSSTPAWSVLPAPLFMTPAHRLDWFIKDFLQPNENFLKQTLKAVDIICKFLRENCFRHSTTKVQSIIKGGSAAKGTALKTGSDADIIVFLNSLESFPSQKTYRSKIIQEIRQQMEACQQQQAFEVKFEVSKWTARRVLSFSLKSRELNESVDFDVLPAYNVLGQRKSTLRAYAELIHLYQSSDTVGGEFSTCFTELQRDFILSRPTKLKDLIRLVKHWYKQCEKKMKSKGSLPPKYALELLTVYAWERGSGADDFSTAKGFRTVLELITKYQQLCIYWTVNYNFDDETIRSFVLTQIQRPRPVILDPAEPTGDVGGGDRWCWHLLAKEAKEWFSSLCFRDGQGNSIQPWKVPCLPASSRQLNALRDERLHSDQEH
ncbi:2'-5'-oligoadenylate synthase 2 isoform X1 [Heterocephalus glaber]|uniref:2'-5' oligoadenylate synthase n=1 Tax=Heterocephalus glaber TaxID=10181 RepID=A0AAX6P4Q2_HETGA|nr:2'-5'-oligoadenylate synthase 2 isoform X1 [Heterocephalus glaber]